MSQITIGVDIGGTNVKCGLINASGKIIARTRLETKSYVRHKIKLIDAICQAVMGLVKQNRLVKKQIAGVGIGFPGLVDSSRGVVHVLPNIPGWKNVAIKKNIQDKLKIPTFIDNDVNMISLGEWRFGAGRGYRNLLCMTLGTGIGGGLILNNGLYRGEGFAAGELGHMPLNEKGPKCNCGGFGCYERYVGNKYLVLKAVEMFGQKNISIEDVFDLAKAGNRKALKYWNDVGSSIGNGLVGIVNLLNPQLIVIGGGVANNFRFIAPVIRQTIADRCMNIQKKQVKVVRASLGDDAGLIGAQVLVKGKGFGI